MAQIGNYDVSVTSEDFFIYPEDKEGNSMRVPVSRTCFHLSRLGTTVTFKRYKHRGRWYWNDSRVKGPCSEELVFGEIARMLFKNDKTQAKNLVLSGLCS